MYGADGTGENFAGETFARRRTYADKGATTSGKFARGGMLDLLATVQRIPAISFQSTTSTESLAAKQWQDEVPADSQTGLPTAQARIDQAIEDPARFLPGKAVANARKSGFEKLIRNEKYRSELPSVMDAQADPDPAGRAGTMAAIHLRTGIQPSLGPDDLLVGPAMAATKAIAKEGIFLLRKYGGYSVEFNNSTLYSFGANPFKLVPPSSRGANLSARIDLSDQFKFAITKDGYVSMRYGNPEIHGLVVSVDKKGVLGFEIRAGGNSETQGSGRDMFISAMKRLEKEGVEVSNIRGTWIQGTDSVNAKQYLSNLKLMPEMDAARNTWTGRIASDFGFSKVESVKTSYGITTVIFGR